jgi:predicted PurR-regulated permease PerM
VPVVDRLAAHMGRKAAAAIVLLGLIAVTVGAVSIAIVGIVDQAPQIRAELAAGIDTIRDALADAGIELPTADDIVDQAEAIIADPTPGAGSALGSAFSSFAAFLAGTAVGLFLLFYLLADWRMLTGWVGTHLSVPEDLGAGIVEDAVWSVRRYFSALTVTSLVTAVIIGVTAALLGVPLAFTIALVTFVTSYVPYVGAFVSGAFAVLIALGAGGVSDAIVILGVILLVQIVVQPILQNRMTASELDLHPVVSFGSTIVGGAVAGVLGATLSAPIVAMIVRITDRVKRYPGTAASVESQEQQQQAAAGNDAPVGKSRD